MPKITFNAHELVEPSISSVALVKRGANRVPFRITKKDDDDMIDLAQSLKTLTKTAAPATTEASVVAILVSKADKVADVAKIFKAAGFDLEDTKVFSKKEADGGVYFAKSDVANLKDADTVILKAAGDVGIVMTGPQELIKSLQLYDWESTSFADIMSKGSFTPTLMVAQDMLQRTFFNIMESAENTKDLATQLGKATDDFKSFITGLAKSLPAGVVKADIALHKAEEISANPAVDTMAGRPNGVAGGKQDVAGGTGPVSNDIEANPAADEGADPDQASLSGGKMGIPGNPPNNDIEGNPVERAGSTAVAKADATVQTPAQVGTKGTAGEDRTLQPGDTQSGAGSKDNNAEMMAVVKTMFTEALTGVTAGITAVQKDIGTISERLSKVETQVKKTDEAVNGTVTGSEPGDKTGVTKSEEGSSNVVPLIDTALTPISEIQKMDERIRGRR